VPRARSSPVAKDDNSAPKQRHTNPLHPGSQNNA
jgi:hypothetical protein